jgi:hypothetical protein
MWPCFKIQLVHHCLRRHISARTTINNDTTTLVMNKCNSAEKLLPLKIVLPYIRVQDSPYNKHLSVIICETIQFLIKIVIGKVFLNVFLVQKLSFLKFLDRQSFLVRTIPLEMASSMTIEALPSILLIRVFLNSGCWIPLRNWSGSRNARRYRG